MEPAADLILNQALDKGAIYRLALQETAPIGRRAAFLHLLERRYKKHYKWIEELASSRVDGTFKISSGGRLFSQFLYTLDGVAPLATAEEDKENAHLREEAERQRKKIKQLQKELEQTEERAGRVHKRFKEQDLELQGLEGIAGGKRKWRKTPQRKKNQNQESAANRGNPARFRSFTQRISEIGWATQGNGKSTRLIGRKKPGGATKNKLRWFKTPRSRTPTRYWCCGG